MVITVDLDGTLCIERNEWWEYSKAEPIPEAIRKINQLYIMGHTIVVYTARFPEDEEVTKQWLKIHSVKYHRIVFGKFRAEMYIDNNSLRMEEVDEVNFIV